MRITIAASIIGMLLVPSYSFGMSACVSPGLLDRKVTADGRVPNENWTQAEIYSVRKSLTEELAAAEMECQVSDSALAASEEQQARVQRRADADRLRISKLPGVRVGMSKKTVLEKTNWGKPLEVNTTTTSAGTREQWVYGSQSYLYFVNGVLTVIQN